MKYFSIFKSLILTFTLEPLNILLMFRAERAVEEGEIDMVVGTVTIGSLNNISCLLQDMDCKGRLGTWPQGGKEVRGRGRQ
jgi:hypothetical protein